MGWSMVKGKSFQQSFSDISLSPSEAIKRYIVQLSKECTEHLADSLNNNKEMYAFAMKTWAFSIMLESYTPDEVKPMVKQHYKELDDKIKELKEKKDTDKLSEDNVNKNIVLTRFNYALPIFEQNIRIMQNSKIVEVEVEGIIDLEQEGFKDRVRTTEHAGDITMTKSFEENDDDSFPD